MSKIDDDGNYELHLCHCPSCSNVRDAIRLDAYLAGMLRAANIAYKADANDSPSHIPAQQAILTAANNLKPEDLK